MDSLKENRIPVGQAKQKYGNEYSKYVGQRYMAQRSYYFCITNDFKTQKNKEMLPGSSIHGILQARVLEWVAIAFARS